MIHYVQVSDEFGATAAWLLNPEPDMWIGIPSLGQAQLYGAGEKPPGFVYPFERGGDRWALHYVAAVSLLSSDRAAWTIRRGDDRCMAILTGVARSQEIADVLGIDVAKVRDILADHMTFRKVE